jgi:hypothetical protein
MSQKRRNGPSIRVSIPRSLNEGILRIQLQEGLDFGAAAERAASLLEPNAQLFKQEVQKAAQQLERTQFMQQMNSARASIRSQGYREGVEYVRAHETHFEAPCSICGKPMKFSNADLNWEEVKKTLYDAFKVWYHVPCKK